MKDIAIEYLGEAASSFRSAAPACSLTPANPARIGALCPIRRRSRRLKSCMFVSHHDDHFSPAITICAAKQRPIFSGLTFRALQGRAHVPGEARTFGA